jgi:hypothetical protein
MPGPESSAEERDHVDFLMEKLARQLDTRSHPYVGSGQPDLSAIVAAPTKQQTVAWANLAISRRSSGNGVRQQVATVGTSERTRDGEVSARLGSASADLASSLLSTSESLPLASGSTSS